MYLFPWLAWHCLSHCLSKFVLICCLSRSQFLTDPYYMRNCSQRGGKGRPMGHPKVRKKHWQAQVVRLNTFGASKSHRHLVVIHQHMRWNVSPSLNIVSAGIQLMHGSFLSGARWRTVLAGSAKTHTFMSTLMPCTYISLYLTQDLINRLSLAWPL